MDDPDYVQFLVHPEKRILAVRRGSEKDFCAQKVYWTTLTDKKQCCEYYSKYFVKGLAGLLDRQNDEWSTYRTTGRISQKKDWIIFDLNQSEIISDEAEPEESAG